MTTVSHIHVLTLTDGIAADLSSPTTHNAPGHITKLSHKTCFRVDTSFPVAGAKYILRSAFLYVCRLAYLQNHTSYFTKFSVHITWGGGSIVLRWQCNMSCTSGFVNDATFSYNKANGPNSNTTLCFVQFARWRQRGEVWRLRLHLVFDKCIIDVILKCFERQSVKSVHISRAL